MKSIWYENISIKIDYILGIEEWKDEDKTFFFGEFQTDDQGSVVDGSWKFFFNTIEPHKKVYKGDYVKGKIFFLSQDDKNYESLLSREKEIQKNLNFRSIGKHDSFEISSVKDRKEHGITILQDGSSLWVDSYLDGIKEGPHEEWVSNGDFDITLPHRIENFRNDKLEGLCQYFWDFCDHDGNPWPSYVMDEIFEKECLPLERTTNYKDGKKDGLERIYIPYIFESPSEFNYEEGHKEGAFKDWKWIISPSASEDFVYVKGKYKDNLLEGPVVEYFKNGEIYRRSIFIKGKLL